MLETATIYRSERGELRYFDMDGNEIHEGDTVRLNADDLPNSREIESCMDPKRASISRRLWSIPI